MDKAKKSQVAVLWIQPEKTITVGLRAIGIYLTESDRYPYAVVTYKPEKIEIETLVQQVLMTAEQVKSMAKVLSLASAIAQDFDKYWEAE